MHAEESHFLSEKTRVSFVPSVRPRHESCDREYGSYVNRENRKNCRIRFCCDQAARIAEACSLGGVGALEITFTPEANRVIERLAKQFFSQILLGAGTALDPETARIDILAGAQFVVSPAPSPESAPLCNRYPIPTCPALEQFAK